MTSKRSLSQRGQSHRHELVIDLVHNRLALNKSSGSWHVDYHGHGHEARHGDNRDNRSQLRPHHDEESRQFWLKGGE